MIEEILKVNGLVIKDFDKDIRSNKKYALIAVKQNPKSINYINKLLYSDYEIVMSALEKDASLIKIVNTVDYNMALKLIKENSNNIYLLNNYSSDYDIALEAVKKDGYKISAINIDANNFEQYNKLALEAVKQNGKALKFVSKYATNYSDICKEAIKENPHAYRYINFNYISEESKRELNLFALSKNVLVFNYFDRKSKFDKEYLKIVFKENKELIDTELPIIKYGLKVKK